MAKVCSILLPIAQILATFVFRRLKVLQEESLALRSSLEGIFTSNFYANQHANQRRQLFAGAVCVACLLSFVCEECSCAQDHAVTVNSLVAEGQVLGRSDTMLDDINDTAGSVLLRLQAQGGTLKVGATRMLVAFHAISLRCRESNVACWTWQQH